MTTLLVSQGVPMIAHGDELGRTQGGNNNVYCQDNAISWIDWDLGREQQSLFDFSRHVVQLRQDHPVFRRRRFFQGNADHGGRSEVGDIVWFGTQGSEMTEEDWQTGYARTLAVLLNGDAIPEPGPLGQRIKDDDFVMMFNAHHEDVDFVVPDVIADVEWEKVVDTQLPTGIPDPTTALLASGETLTVGSRSMVVVKSRPIERDVLEEDAEEAEREAELIADADESERSPELTEKAAERAARAKEHEKADGGSSGQE
ncbi:hypothetical protein GCM10025883_17650 [Mobilicoccus caccae]|uniref:Glycogen debranching enzyme GlgX n=1 Tax=Mobilicoccus caccae TaxID=1859295 RepID=A0ABQ6IQV3_9MICO|nr:hypothetical protein GCM10025883_17650 [Mobilicoccus caccae]